MWPQGVVIAAMLTHMQLTPAQDDYSALVDPTLKVWTQAVRVAEDQVLLLELKNGELTAATVDGTLVSLTAEESAQLSSVFPKEARQPPPIEDGAWAAKVQQFAEATRVDIACPVRAENHLEKAIVEVYNALRGSPHGAVLNIGGIYGGRDGEGREIPDDPSVELLLHVPGARALCWNCGDVAGVTRAGSLMTRFKFQTVDLADADLRVPIGFEQLDLLRMDSLPGGCSCQVLKRLLRVRVRPRLVALLVLSQVPPPFRFVPLKRQSPPPFFSCSLAAAAEVLSPYNISLVRLTGPYALFASHDAWAEPLPLSDLDCYRGASIWGYKDLPLAFVREWLFSPTDDVLSHLWNNISSVYAAAGQPNAPFTLGL